MVTNPNDISDTNAKTSEPYKILIVGDPDITTSFIHSAIENITQEGKNQFSMFIAKVQINDMRFELWHCDKENNKINKEQFESAQGVIALFNKGDENSFNYIPHCITEVIANSGKMLPTYVVGMVDENTEDDIPKEDILEYLYNLGNTASCLVPYAELEVQEFADIESVLTDLVRIIDCNQIEKCYAKPAIIRGKCGLKQFNSNLPITH